MIELGASYELLGRFRMIANYYRLSESSVRVLIGKYGIKYQINLIYNRIIIAIKIAVVKLTKMWFHRT